jgi:hypothetical protein
VREFVPLDALVEGIYVVGYSIIRCSSGLRKDLLNWVGFSIVVDYLREHLRMLLWGRLIH